MAKSKTKTYAYDPEGDAVVSLGEGRAPLRIGDDYRTHVTDDPVEQAALDANPDFSEVSKARESSSRKKDK